MKGKSDQQVDGQENLVYRQRYKIFGDGGTIVAVEHLLLGTKVEDTALAGIMKLVAEAQAVSLRLR
jgi:hypothetical protein